MSHETDQNNPIPISWLCKDDLINCRPDLASQIEAIPQQDVAYIADKVGDSLQDTYWLAVSIILNSFFKSK